MTPVIVKRNALERAIVVICSSVLWVTMVLIFLILTANTLLRYASGTSLQWSNEIPELLFPWLVMSGVVLAAEKGAHIATVFLVEAVKASTKRGIEIISWSAVAVMYAVLVRATWNMLEIVHDERTPILLIPTSVTYGCPLTELCGVCKWRVTIQNPGRKPLKDNHHDLFDFVCFLGCGHAGHAHRPRHLGGGHGRCGQQRPGSI
jgi:TRAP-type C4-dicarboxylate transport system permease small subunit